MDDQCLCHRNTLFIFLTRHCRRLVPFICKSVSLEQFLQLCYTSCDPLGLFKFSLKIVPLPVHFSVGVCSLFSSRHILFFYFQVLEAH